MRYTFHAVPAVRAGQRNANVTHALALGLGSIPAGTGRLAVVGSGHSLAAYEETLRRWRGPIWATNGAFPWLKERGIRAAFFAIHPTDSILKHMSGIDSDDTAILALQCPPAVYAAAAPATRFAFDDLVYPGAGAPGHAAYQGIVAGYTEVTFFGCDLSFTDGKTHIGGSVDKPSMAIRVGGCDYLTTPAYYCQALGLRDIIAAAPRVFRERSAGLLRALIEDHDEEVVWTSEAVKAMRDPDLVALGFPDGVIDLTDPTIRTFTIGAPIHVAAE